jgi:hypothetical protein
VAAIELVFLIICYREEYMLPCSQVLTPGREVLTPGREVPVDAEEAWLADLEDEEPPEDEPEYWEDDELTPEELTAWADAMEAAERTAPTPDDGRPRPEGGVPDLVVAALEAGGDPALMTDADLLGSLAGWHAVAARAVARELRATEELLRRRRPRVWDRCADRAESRREDLNEVVPAEPGPERVMPAVVPSREAASELALALTFTEYSAQAQVELTADLSRRLPVAFAELDAGRADLHRVRVLAEGTQFLSDEDAGQVDTLLSPRLGEWTTGDLKVKIRRAVMAIDPVAADRRAAHAARKARFGLYANPDQTATAAIERMPAHLGAAVKARVNAIARAAKAAGMTGPLALLEAKVATGLLLDTLPDIPPPRDDGGPADPGPAGPWDDGWPAGWFPPPAPGADDDADVEDCGRADSGPDFSQPDQAGGQMSWPPIPAQAGRDGPGCHGLPRWLIPKNPGRTRLTVPWRTLTGIGAGPGELSWIGPITVGQSRDLAAAAAADPACAWRLIITDDGGRALASTTLRTRRDTGTSPPGLIREVTLTIAATLAAGLAEDGQSRDWITAAITRLTRRTASTPAGTGPGKLAGLLTQAIPAANAAAAEAAARAAADTAAGGCAHTRQAPGYRVPDKLRRWLNTRDRICRNPICRRPAAQCDQDHTRAYDRGGRTCPCNLGGLCRVHHQLKQLPGWQLGQDAQGYFTWTTPAGLTYRKEPYRYAI